MAELKKIVEFLDEYLNHANIKDSSFNGLQFEGNQKVDKIMFAVDAGIDTFNKAVELGANMIVVHHGQFWDKNNPSIKGFSKERMKILFENDISLYVSHLPLDMHREVGNNAQLLNLLGAEIVKEFGEMDGQYISYVGKVDGMTIDEVKDILDDSLGTDCHVLDFGKTEIKSIAVCSGGGGLKIFGQAVDLNPDLYITGEQTEIYHLAKDSGINVIFAGHHATEIVGVKALSKVVSEKFDVSVEFVDLPTGL